MHRRLLRFSLLMIAALAASRPGHALPKFAREYGVGCETCHSVPPRLNSFGLAFQANHFNWPGGGTAPRSGLKSLLPSAVVTFRAADNRSQSESSVEFEELQLFFAGGLRVAPGRPGGYLASASVATREEDPGSMEEAFASVPIAGRRGELAFTAGQSSPLMYQWWHHTRLVSAPPAALMLGSIGGEMAMADEHGDEHGTTARVAHADTGGHGHVDGEFSFAEHQPSLRLDYFSGRGTGTADGRYLTIGIPFEGELALNRSARIGGAQGIFAHAFQRWGQNTLGAFAYTHDGHHLEGLIGTRALRPDLTLLGIGALGENDEGTIRRLSVEGEYTASPRLALTARLEALGGAENDLGSLAALTYYPLKLPTLRLTLQTTQRKGNRSLELWARGQF